MLIDDREQAEEAIDRALSLDPQDTFALETRSYYRAGIKGDVEGALSDAELAVSIAPGSATLWNTLGLAQSQRGALRESVASMQKAIALDAADPLTRTNLAFIYMEENRFAEAKEQIDIALQLDPSLDAALAARGRYYLQTNDHAKAQQDLLAATTANPASAQSLLLLAAAYYQSGNPVAGEQALDNADRLDRNDPVIASVRTAIAVDEFRADDAIIAAQDALKRTRDRGGDYAALSASQDAGSTLNSAFRLLNLNAWGRFYGDAVFDPFSGSSYFDQALAGSVNPFINNLRFGNVPTEPETNDTSASSLLQGLLLSPQSLAAPSGSPTALLYPFLEVLAGGGVTVDNGDVGWQASLEVQGFAAGPIPTSLYVNVEGLEAGSLRGDDPVETGQYRLDDRSITGTGYIASRPTLNDTVVGYVTSQNFEFDLGVITPEILVPFFGESVPQSGDARSTNAGVAWAHTFGYHNVATVGFLTNLLDENSSVDTPFITADGDPLLPRTEIEHSQQTYIGAFNHSVELGAVTLRYGVEAGTIRGDTMTAIFLPPVPPLEEDVSTFQTDLDTRRAYFDALYEITPNLKVEAGLFGTSLQGEFTGTNVDEERLEPRVGIAWAPLEGQYLRAGFLRESSVLSSTTLAPIGVVGLQSNQARLAPNGYMDTIATRWESQWTQRLFTAVDYQHQEFHNQTIGIPATADTISLSEGRLDRVSATANVWIGGGLGAFATYAYTDSSNEDPDSVGFGQPLAFVPEHSGRVALTYVHPSNVKATLAATSVGDRAGDEAGTEIDGYWSTDAFLTWEP
ncbi:MAG TPA: TonB-dependent receptor, partial [Tianweitania sediminis]|nr:TonB-dependent receptor [Tianweitania sediminis]